MSALHASDRNISFSKVAIWQDRNIVFFPQVSYQGDACIQHPEIKQNSSEYEKLPKLAALCSEKIPGPTLENIRTQKKSTLVLINSQNE